MKVSIMFYISEEELRFKKDTNPNYLNEKLCHVFIAVSTHSRLKAAVFKTLSKLSFGKFQHTAA